MSPVTTGHEQLVAIAEAEIRTLSVEEARDAQASGALLVDLRDVREVQRDGMIPGSYHVPRGMLEFWVDPSSPYHHEALTSADQLVLYCDLGWRSALAAKTLQEMGFTNVGHIGGGLEAWKDVGGPIERADG
ncbi:MAG: rhodanese-like domain-containing protein [Acidimicrobiia bacterium]